MSFVVLQMNDNGPMGDSAAATNTTESGVNAPKPWERALTVEEMRDTASNWHLANDVGVSCLLLMIISICISNQVYIIHVTMAIC